jgi:A/G-specific adenine glycosylase
MGAMQSRSGQKKTKQERLVPEGNTSPDPFAAVPEFREKIRKFFRNHRRPMPWRETTDPYGIVVSEVMLQQTQVPRVMTKYPEFIAAFPDFPSLAAAPLDDVLRVWQGMGYNRRAIALRRIAEKVVDEFGGKFPDDPAVLETFPGIGKATAASIAAFAFNAPVVFIETNIRRVFIHCFFADREGVRDEEILPLVAAALDRENPREWYWALMDYGTYLKTRVENPNRRSAHYARQSKFEGSRRQVRGKILRVLLERGSVTGDELAELAGSSRDILEELLGELAGEGFLVRDGERITLVRE